MYNHLLSQRQLSEPETKIIFSQICGAVTYIHSRGLVHRDLKLENIFLDRKKNVKLGDFGFARENDKSLLETWCGTLTYSSPEMLRCDKYHGEPVDIWSLGIILYTLLHGQLPFDDDDDLATHNKILHDDPIFPPFFNEDARDLITKMLHKNPAERPRAKEVLSHQFLQGHGQLQLDNLKQPYAPGFDSKIEKNVLDRMVGAGIDLEHIMYSVMEYKCDGLSGWWWLALEKERKRDLRARNRRTSSGEKRNSENSHVVEISGFQISTNNHRLKENTLTQYKFPEIESSGITDPKLGPPSVATNVIDQLQRLDAQSPHVSEGLVESDTPLKLPCQSLSSGQLDDLTCRKTNIMQALKQWFMDQKKPKTIPKRRPPPICTNISGSPLMASSAFRVSDSSRSPRPASQRKGSTTSQSNSRAGSRRRRSQSQMRVASTERSSSSPVFRPPLRRTTSVSSTHSSVTSHGDSRRVSHSKASSTSSNSTFASTRSLRTVRTTLKVMPSTPPPHMISHKGAFRERNVFDQTLTNGVVFATRKKRGVMVRKGDSADKGRRRIDMSDDLIEEVEEEADEEDLEPEELEYFAEEEANEFALSHS